MKYFVLGAQYVIRFDAGEKIIETLKTLCERGRDRRRLLPRAGRGRRGRDRALRPASNAYSWLKVPGPSEIVSLYGNITAVDGRPFIHAHIALGDQSFAVRGGHLKEATVSVTCEITLATTADVVEFTGRHDFGSFKQNTAALNDLATYMQLLSRAAQCGYKIGNVVYRGYGAAESLQQMHNQAIEARTKLQLDRATEQQAQELQNYRLESQLGRASRRRAEQSEEGRHELEVAREKNDADLKLRSQQQDFPRQQRAADSRLRVEMESRRSGRGSERASEGRRTGSAPAWPGRTITVSPKATCSTGTPQLHFSPLRDGQYEAPGD